MKTGRTKKRTIAFREIHSVGEMMEMLKLLRGVYGEMAYADIAKIPDDDDRRSTHFGLFDVTAITCSRLIGCARIVDSQAVDESSIKIDRVALKEEYRNATVEKFIEDCANAWANAKSRIVNLESDKLGTYAQFFQAFDCVREEFEIDLSKERSLRLEGQEASVREAA